MDIQELRYFLSVYRNLSFSKAAKECFVTQPLISRKIAALEEEFHGNFFYRNSQGVFPTETGELFYTYASHMLSDYDEALKTICQHVNNNEKNLLIAAVTPAAASFLPKAIAEFYDCYSDVQVVLDRYTPREMQEILNNKHYDFYITLMHDLRKDGKLHVRRLIHDKICLITKTDNMPENDIQAEQLLRCSAVYTISREQSPYFYNIAVELLGQLGIDHSILREIQPVELLNYYVSANMGVAISPRMRGNNMEGDLSSYTLMSGPEVELGVAWRGQLARVKTVFLDMLLKASQD